MGVASTLRTHTVRRLLALSGRRTVDLSSLERVPDRLTWPLQRAGVDPTPRLDQLRDREPVHLLASFLGLKVWLVTGPAEARSVLANATDFSNDIRPFVGGTGSDDQQIGGLGFTDPPDHTRLRHLLTPQFTIRKLARLRPFIEAVVARQLEVLEERGADADLVRDLAFPVPFAVICELLGLPDDDRESFRDLSARRFDVSSGGMNVFGAVSESRRFLMEVTRRQRSCPGDGLIGDIIRDQGDAISDLDLAGLADGVFTGGLETSASMLALGTLVLLDRPEDYRAVATRPEAVEPIVEELLRLVSPVQIAFPRFVRHGTEVGGRRLAAGDVVICHLAAANRAPADPHGTAGRRGPASHLAFGHGFHRCVGAELARLELRSAFPALARRFPDLALGLPADGVDYRPLSIVFGVDSLPVRLHG